MVELLQSVLALLTNEIMMNNRDNEDNDNAIANIFIGLFSVLLFVGIVCFCVFAYFKWIKGKKLFKNIYTDYYNYCRSSLIYKNGNNFARHYK